MKRTLTLKSESLRQLTAAELDVVAAGTVGGGTGISCLDYISCWPWQCLPTFDYRCIQ